MRKLTTLIAAMSLIRTSMLGSSTALAVDASFDVFFQVDFDPDTGGPSISAQGTQTTTQPTRTTTIVLRREHRVGEGVRKEGAKLATVVLEDGVGLNFLVDAIRNGVAGEVVVEPETADAGALEPSGKLEND